MRLDVIVPTYNRQELLARTLRSLLAARVPEGLDVHVTVVDNNSKDATREVVESFAGRFGARLHYVFEDSAQGRSVSLNAGIRATAAQGGELVGMIDDDEEVDAAWYEVAHRAFTSDARTAFVGGPCKPRWGARQPAWLPMDYLGVIGWIECGDKVLTYGEDHPGMLMGGNVCIRRDVLEQVGLYRTALGRTDKKMLSGEDQDMFERLMQAGARGLYLPELIIYHYVPAERLTKKYFRRWCFWNSVSLGLLDRERRAPVAYLGGVPRWMYRNAARGLLTATKAGLGRNGDSSRAFSEELDAWKLAGFFYGKHFYRS
ncbi:MAG TPA: glycosyltransferase family A protein [Pyrinomonadaceae bacterium]|nr:glycosyltransferase family A protein [Pyrinomonadaceae bacterium]